MDAAKEKKTHPCPWSGGGLEGKARVRDSPTIPPDQQFQWSAVFVTRLSGGWVGHSGFHSSDLGHLGQLSCSFVNRCRVRKPAGLGRQTSTFRGSRDDFEDSLTAVSDWAWTTGDPRTVEKGCLDSGLDQWTGSIHPPFHGCQIGSWPSTTRLRPWRVGSWREVSSAASPIRRREARILGDGAGPGHGGS